MNGRYTCNQRRFVAIAALLLSATVAITAISQAEEASTKPAFQSF
jgi:hypothetical protein